ncbi:M10 family metallopeptidase C-terminal domain-containing protein [Brevundimonas sp. SL161]|uniref:M10 family metallopeptidase C-terminal domain-containing protein n=1 Tax=Brevundimonas sp. SL161 TaxID=2804613 RepID=UPI003CEC37B7
MADNVNAPTEATSASAFGDVGGYARCASCGGFHSAFDGGGASPYSALNADDRGEVGPNGKNSLTTDEAAAQLGRSNLSWATGLGQSTTVTFAFRSTAPTTLPSDVTDFSRFSGVQVNATLQALGAWSDVANIQFAQVSDGDGYSNSATILFSNYNSGANGSAAFAYLPGSSSISSVSGDVWINGSISYNANPVLLGYGYQVLTHEIGHAIGLSHPAAYNAGEGVTITYSTDAVYYEDSRQYTVMSYFNESNTGGNFNSASGARQYSAAPLLDDIAAAQRMYGVNTTTRTGDTVYGFNSTADRAWYAATTTATDVIFAVWDAGGTDTLDFSGYAESQLIDLRQGAFSDVGGLVGNVAIAIGTVIENAVGGSGSDRLIGNGANNRLTGGAGADSIDGGLGNDTVVFSGPRSAYTITGSGTSTIVSGPDGTDVLTNVEVFQFSDGAVLAQVPGSGVTVSGDVMDNVIEGTEFADSLSGLGGRDTLNGRGGDDSLNGGTGDDRLDGGTGNDVLTGGAGNDTLLGGDGFDIAVFQGASGIGVNVNLGTGAVGGGDGVDSLTGIEGLTGSIYADTLTGDAGNNVIEGGGGSDVLRGGAGSDRISATGAPGQAGGAADIVKAQTTANATIATAVNLDGGFDLLARGDVGNATTIPHATVLGRTHGGVEYYAIAVGAGATVTFDIDGAAFDSSLRLFNGAGVELAANDDNNGDNGGARTDSYLTYTFQTAGTYYVEVSEWATGSGSTFTSKAPLAGLAYTLHVSVPGHAVVAATLVGSTLEGGAGDDTLVGGLGGDVLAGGAGNDVIDGGAGDDVVQFSGVASDYVLTRTSAGWQIVGTDGLDTLSNVERIQFGAAAPIAIDVVTTARFDPLTYIASNPDLIVAFGTDTARATAHYDQYQASSPRPIDSFKALVYTASHPDLVRAFGTDTVAATLHYIQFGFAEGRETATFNPLIYAASNLDLALAFGSNSDAAARHFLTFGAQNTHAVTGFQPLIYVASSPDLARTIGNDLDVGLRHYLDTGVREGRPTTGFDPLVYTASYADLAKAFGLSEPVALQHYLVFGADEGRSPNLFDGRLYAASHLDLARALGSDSKAAAIHYIQYGVYEGRQTSGFDPVAYLLSQGDLAGRTPSSALDHWLTFGADEGRDGDGAFGLEQTSHALTGASTSGALEAAGDRDWFELRAAAGQKITIDVAASGAGGGSGSLTDGSVSIFNALGQRIAFDNDSGPGLDARLTFTAPAAGTFYLVVGSEVGATGTYRVLTATGSAEFSQLAQEGWGQPVDPLVYAQAGLVLDEMPISVATPWLEPLSSELGWT